MKPNPVALRTTLLGALAAVSLAAVAQAPPPAAALQPHGAATKGHATQVEAPPSLPSLTAAQLVERNLQARGTEAAWAKVQSLTFTGKMDAGRERKDGGTVVTNPVQAKAEARARGKLILEGKAPVEEAKIIRLPFTMDFARPKKSRIEVPFAGQTAVQVYDGTQGWKLRPYLGRHEVESFSEDEMRIAGEQQELDGPLVNATAKGTRVELDGTERVDGHPAYRLKLTLKSGEVRHLWLDATTYLESRLEVPPRRWNGKLRPVSVYFSNYKSVGGLQIPHTLETRVAGQAGGEKMDIEKVVVNPALPADRFAKPN